MKTWPPEAPQAVRVFPWPQPYPPSLLSPFGSGIPALVSSLPTSTLFAGRTALAEHWEVVRNTEYLLFKGELSLCCFTAGVEESKGVCLQEPAAWQTDTPF